MGIPESENPNPEPLNPTQVPWLGFWVGGTLIITMNLYKGSFSLHISVLSAYGTSRTPKPEQNGFEL